MNGSEIKETAMTDNKNALNLTKRGLSGYLTCIIMIILILSGCKPTPVMTITKVDGLRYHFDGSKSMDIQDKVVKWEWDFEADGTYDAQGSVVDHVYTSSGNFTVRLRVTDSMGMSATKEQKLTASVPVTTKAYIPINCYTSGNPKTRLFESTKIKIFDLDTDKELNNLELPDNCDQRDILAQYIPSYGSRVFVIAYEHKGDFDGRYCMYEIDTTTDAIVNETVLDENSPYFNYTLASYYNMDTNMYWFVWNIGSSYYLSLLDMSSMTVVKSLDITDKLQGRQMTFAFAQDGSALYAVTKYANTSLADVLTYDTENLELVSDTTIRPYDNITSNYSSSSCFVHPNGKRLYFITEKCSDPGYCKNTLSVLHIYDIENKVLKDGSLITGNIGMYAFTLGPDASKIYLITKAWDISVPGYVDSFIYKIDVDTDKVPDCFKIVPPRYDFSFWPWHELDPMGKYLYFPYGYFGGLAKYSPANDVMDVIYTCPDNEESYIPYGRSNVIAGKYPKISGRLTSEGEGIAGVKVQLTGNGLTFVSYTDHNGGYKFYVPNGSYHVAIVTESGQYFSKQSEDVIVENDNNVEISDIFEKMYLHITSNITNIIEGDPVILTWKVRDADPGSVSITPGLGSVGASGSAVVNPSQTTTYVISAKLSGKTYTASVSVSVTLKPRITLTCDKRRVSPGESATLSWSVTNATSITFDPQIVTGTPPMSGSANVSPASTKEYSLSAKGPGGSASTYVTLLVKTGLTYYHHDIIGNTIAQTDDLGRVVMKGRFLPYGLAYQDLSNGGTPETRLYTGKERDKTGLDYFGARYYDSSLGRFLSVDPAGPDPMNPMSWNRYAYCLNNPYKYIDPDGRLAFYWHFLFTYEASRENNMSIVDGLNLAWKVMCVDRKETQGTDADSANIHAMAGKLPSGRYQRSEEAIDATIEDINVRKGRLSPQSIHTSQDFATPAHCGIEWRKFHWDMESFTHIFGDMFPSEEVRNEAYQNTSRILNGEQIERDKSDETYIKERND